MVLGFTENQKQRLVSSLKPCQSLLFWSIYLQRSEMIKLCCRSRVTIIGKSCDPRDTTTRQVTGIVPAFGMSGELAHVTIIRVVASSISVQKVDTSLCSPNSATLRKSPRTNLLSLSNKVPMVE